MHVMRDYVLYSTLLISQVSHISYIVKVLNQTFNHYIRYNVYLLIYYTKQKYILSITLAMNLYSKRHAINLTKIPNQM